MSSGCVIPMACQIRMGRAALNWTIKDLADHASISQKTVQRLERDSKSQASTVHTIESIVRAFVAHGIVLTPAGSDGLGAGVRLRDPNRRL